MYRISGFRIGVFGHVYQGIHLSEACGLVLHLSGLDKVGLVNLLEWTNVKMLTKGPPAHHHIYYFKMSAQWIVFGN